jgi:anti-sigma B factor antagonist
MKIRKRMVDDVAVVVLSGPLDSQSVQLVRNKVAGLLSGNEHVAVDFSGVSCVSSVSLRAMLLLYRQAQVLDRTIAITGLSPEVHNVLEATGFLNFFIVSDSVEQCVVKLQNTLGGKELEHAAAAT